MPPTARPIALAAAVLSAAALGATTLAVPAAAAPVAKVVGGTFDWGVLESYRKYVTRPVAEGGAGGTIEASGGAVVHADGTFRLDGAEGAYDSAAHTVKAAFKGGVTFKSPAHGFEVTLSDFRFDTATRQVTADVAQKGGTPRQDVPLAAFALAGQSTENLPTTLTQDAATELGGPYKDKPGDPLTVKLEFEKAPSPGPSPSGSGSGPQSPSPEPPVTPSPADGPQQVLGARLTWGVKESFRRYVAGQNPARPNGSVTPEGGAAGSGDTFSFAFGKGELDVKQQKLTASFVGDLRFQRADHGIDMTFGNVRISTEGDKGTLVLDVKTAAGTRKDVPFATLGLSEPDYRTSKGVLALNGVRAALTAQGAQAFVSEAMGSLYKEGDRVDDVNLSVSVEKDAVLPAPPGTTSGTPGTAGSVGGSGGGPVGGPVGGSVGGNLAATGADVPAGALLGASAAAVAAGAGAVHLARRRRTDQR
jgi:hypothetical protein